MRRKTFWAFGAVTLSFTLHGLGFGVGLTDQPIQIAGGTPAQTAMLGNSFADMAAGVVTPANTVPDVETPVAPSTAPARPAPRAATTTAVQTAPSAAKAHAPRPVPQPASQTAQPPTVKPVPTPRPKPAPKPVQRPRVTPKPDTKAAPKPAPRGNSNQSGKRGQADGQAGAKAAQSGQAKGQTRQAGNAAVANYPGKVWRKLSRTRKRGRGRGKAIVGFKITATGGVARAWIIRSSGHAKLDDAALKHVHRAAPFPPPPKGAKRQYSYDYIGK